MDDIRRHDRKLLARELLNPGRVLVSAMSGTLLWFSRSNLLWDLSWPWLVAGYAIIALIHVNTSYKEARRKRFINKRFEAMWNGCRDRVEKLEQVLSKLKKDQIADLREMPNTMRQVARELYQALRRADLIAHEVAKTEGAVYSSPPVWHQESRDPQARELYRLADKNIGEYRRQFDAVMAGVQRTEGQSAVFMTTLDSLRMKLISYRLTGKSPEISSQEFLEALQEARLQLEAVDHALDELDLSIFPKTIAIMPPEFDEEQVRRN